MEAILSVSIIFSVNIKSANYSKPKTAVGKKATFSHFNQERELFVFCDEQNDLVFVCAWRKL